MKTRSWIAILVLTTACATGPRPDEAISVRIVGSDGEEIKQIVPLGIRPPEPGRPGDKVLLELGRSVPSGWQKVMLIIVPHSCVSQCERPFELVIFDPDTVVVIDSVMHNEKPKATPGLHAAVEELLSAMKKAVTRKVRYGVFTMERTPNGSWQGYAVYEYFP